MKLLKHIRVLKYGCQMYGSRICFGCFKLEDSVEVEKLSIWDLGCVGQEHMENFGWDLGDFGYLEEFRVEMVASEDLEQEFGILGWYDCQFVVQEGC